MASRWGAGVGLVAGIAALAAGGVAVGLELERRLVNKRIQARDDADDEQFFGLRSAGPDVTTADGVVLHTEVDDVPDSDLTVVWVHGYALSLDCWHFQRKHFRGPGTDRPVRQVLYDQRSHGRSGRSAPEHCRITQLGEDLLQVLDEIAGDGPLVLVGHSMGGMTVMELARAHPELFGSRIRGVGFFCTSAGEMADHSPIRGLPGRTFSRLAPPLMATLNRIPEVVSKARSAGSDLGFVVTRRMAYGSDVPNSYVEFATQMLAETSLDVVADFYPAFAELDEYEAMASLAHIPTAVVGGEDDVITPVEHTERIIDLLPTADAHILPECGHLGMIEHHDQFNAVVEHLLARVRAQL
ncbi:alpha/beta fold hydrolase [Microlunatus ginsengisoli]|uniref:Alpha/beta hydrolase n=1 Tax=Microlunatus ginsengisoli TaxID=363863 RepID=A0ABP6ZUE6_9ACTN